MCRYVSEHTHSFGANVMKFMVNNACFYGLDRLLSLLVSREDVVFDEMDVINAANCQDANVLRILSETGMNFSNLDKSAFAHILENEKSDHAAILLGHDEFVSTMELTKSIDYARQWSYSIFGMMVNNEAVRALCNRKEILLLAIFGDDAESATTLLAAIPPDFMKFTSQDWADLSANLSFSPTARGLIQREVLSQARARENPQPLSYNAFMSQLPTLDRCLQNLEKTATESALLFIQAAAKGDVTTIIRLVESRYFNHRPWEKQAVDAAIQNGHTDKVSLFYPQGF